MAILSPSGLRGGDATRFRLKVIAAALAAHGLTGHAAQPLPPGTVPVASANFVTSGQASLSSAGSTLTVNQATAKAILNWRSFNIARDAAVRFNQPSASSAALNRIHDANPSIIQGRLSANGQIYLINQNGIIFDGTSQINANALVASTLDITDERFQGGLLSSPDPLQAANPAGFVQVEAGAELRSERDGRIVLLAPRVSNAGSIQTPDGQVILAAGQKIYLSASESPALRGLVVEVDGDGQASNLASGRIVVERGNATLAGLAVNQSGRISATTSVSVNGSVRLIARNSAGGGAAVLGSSSRIEILPDGDRSATIQDAQSFNPSSVEISGATVHMMERSSVLAPGGKVTITAQKGPLPSDTVQADARIYLAAGSSIDVGGVRDVQVPIERNVLKVELRGDELKDSPLQRDGALRGKTVYVDLNQGTPLVDVSGYAAQVGRTAQEKAAGGGTVSLRSEGDIVLREGSAIDVSGGSIRYQDGFVRTTKLLSGGRVYDIGEAPADIVYEGLADVFTKTSAKWGVTQTWQAAGRGDFMPGYVEGRNAGGVFLQAHSLAMDGTLLATTVHGPLQRVAGKLPLGGELALGYGVGGQLAPADFWLGNVAFQYLSPKLDASFSFSDLNGLVPLPDQRRDTAYVPLGTFSEAGFARATIVANGKATLPAGGAIVLGPGGSLSLTAREVDLLGEVVAPGGSISVTTRDTVSAGALASDYDIVVGVDARLSTAGTWVNDLPALSGNPPGDRLGPIAVNGGAIVLESVSDLSLASGSVLDVTGGAWAQASGKVETGDAGAITLKTGRLRTSVAERQRSVMDLSGTLLGHGTGLASLGSGGTLTLSAASIAFGQGPALLPGELRLAAAFVQGGGFRAYTFTGVDGVTIENDTVLAPTLESLVLSPRYAIAATGADVRDFATVTVLPAELRKPVSLTLSASSLLYGELEVGEGAAVCVDPTGSIRLSANRQLTVLGTLEAPAGSITLATPKPQLTTDPFFADQSIWLGGHSRLVAIGVDRSVRQANGLQRGEVLAGGTVSIDAGKGYVVTEAGALIDVSGAAGQVDIPQQQGTGARYVRRIVGSDAGTVSIAAREGMLLDGDILGAGAHGARGGELSFSFIGYGSDLLRVNGGAFPDATRRYQLSQSGRSIPLGLQPGVTIDANPFAGDGLNGQAYVFADRIAASGMEALVLRGPDSSGEFGRAEISGDVALRVNRSIELDMPSIAGDPGASLSLQAAQVTLANRNTQLQAPRAVTTGDAELHVEARHIDLVGTLALSGFDQVHLRSTGDIRAVGVLQGSFERRLAGALMSAGDISLHAAQLYPTTLSAYAIDASAQPGATIAIHQTSMPTSVLSAGGELTLHAARIEQGGTVKAPFGRIVLDAEQELVLLPGSVTSVSGIGAGDHGALLIPFGTTELNQRDFVYPLDALRKLVFAAPPEKQIVLDAPSIDVRGAGPVEADGTLVMKEAATVDLSGGGDLYAYEFIPGPGGSSDVLDPANADGSFAILPWLQAEVAPYDHFYSQHSDELSVGASVYLSGVDGLAAGTYAVMPARYALLPGAYLVKQRAGSTDFLPNQAHRLSDGTQVVAGYMASRNLDGSAALQMRSSAFEVAPGSIARTRSEYLDTRASRFFAEAGSSGTGQLPGDAGRLAIVDAHALALGGQLLAASAPGFRGAELDLAVERLAVIGDGDQPAGDGFVSIEAGTLRRLGVSSLLLGGTRSAAGGAVEIQTRSQEVRIATRAEAPLSAEEVIVAATQSVSVAAGSAIEAIGENGGRAPSTYRVKGIGDDDGALLRVAAGGLPQVFRASPARLRGSLDIAPSALLKGGSITLDATLDNRVSAALDLGENGALALSAALISIGDVALVEEGLTLDAAQLAELNGLGQLALRSYSTVDVYGAVDFGGAGLDLTLEAAGLRGFDNDGRTARVQARTLSIGNQNGALVGAVPVLANAASPTNGNGRLELNAGTITLAPNPAQRGFAVTGFASAEMGADQVVASGSGDLTVQGDLTIGAARVTARTGADYRVTSSNALAIERRPSETGLLPADGLIASLHLSGASLKHSGLIDLPAGTVVLETTGANANLTLTDQSVVRVAGVTGQFIDTSAALPAGTVILRSASGAAALAGSIDASGAAGVEAGLIEIDAARGGLRLTGTLAGGEISLDVAALDDFSAVNTALNAGGFGERREFRVRSGDLTVAAADIVDAQSIRMATDDGGITVQGRLDASGVKGGTIELHARRAARAGGDIVIADTALLDASATTPANAPAGSMGDGGRVVLAIADATAEVDTLARIRVANGAIIDLSGQGAGSGGSLLLRAPQLTAGSDGVAIDTFGATLRGAGEAVIEGYRVYSTATIGGTAAGSFDITTSGQAYRDAKSFVDLRTNPILARLGTSLRVRPGVEVRSAGDLTLSQDWNLCGNTATCSAGWRFAGEPGVLTLRAAGDLLLDGSLSDGFSGTTITSGVLRDVASWSYRLVAGADTSRADVLAVIDRDAASAGAVSLAAGKLVRTGTGSIDVAAATDIRFADGASTIYTAGVPTANPAGFATIPAEVTGTSPAFVNNRTPFFPDRGGDIRIFAGEDIQGVASGQFISDWLYRYAQRDTTDATLRTNPQTSWWPRFVDFRQGVGALGGGDVTIVAGGDIEHLAAVIPTNGRLGGDLNAAPAAANLVVQGGGDLRIQAGRDLLSGVFLVDAGSASITAGGSVMASATGAGAAEPMRAVLALGDAQADVYAAGNLEIQTVVDVTALPQPEAFEANATRPLSTFFHRYTDTSRVSLRSGGGDIALFNNQNGAISSNIPQLGTESNALITYPGSLRAVAFAGDIDVNSRLLMAPAPSGNLELLASDSIEFGDAVEMVEVRREEFPSTVAPRTEYSIAAFLPAVPTHAQDPEPVRIYALAGSIVGTGNALNLSKQARFNAGTDIVNLALTTQNVQSSDITRFQAGGDIRFETRRDDSNGQPLLNSDAILVGGPGRIELIAGGTLDLGNSVGVVTKGNLTNPTLAEGGAAVVVLAGFPGEPQYDAFADRYLEPGADAAAPYASALVEYVAALTDITDLTPETAWPIFTGLAADQRTPLLREVFFNELKAAGREAASSGGRAVYERGYTAIETLFPAALLPQARQDINLFFSQIKTEQGGGIDLLNPSGLVNAGLATSGADAKSAAEQGIVTVRGGDVRAFVRQDFLVNRSRVFTLGGGGILIWSSEGNIDAGKGAKTASATPPPVLIVKQDGSVKLDISSSIAGSGIGVLLGEEELTPGDVDLIAPRGEVNAGDAGIRSAGNLTIAALRVVGADNIQVGGVSTGVPVVSAGSLAAGLAGAGNAAAAATRSAEQATQSAAADGSGNLAQSSFAPAFLSVEVIGLGEEEPERRTEK